MNQVSRAVNVKLGKWYGHHHEYNNWKYYLDPKTRDIFQYIDGKYTCFKSTSSRTKTTTFHRRDEKSDHQDIPMEYIPAFKCHGHELCTCRHTSRLTATTPQQTFDDVKPITWKQYVSHLPAWQVQFMKQTDYFNDELLLASLTRSSKILLINDGGVENNAQGTFGTVITNNESVLFKSHGKCYNNHYYQSSYRSEGYALLSGMVLL